MDCFQCRRKGALAEEGHDKGSTPEIYDMNRMSEILYWCERTGRNYWEYVQQCEDEDIWDYLAEVWKTMREAIERGLDQEGDLPGTILSCAEKPPLTILRQKVIRTICVPAG